ncbi:hypothetical protein I550_2452 [Mycobacterium intracellulare 1956]|uniref:Uncharacterized protein n=1 Tax=Mycobacterium intracellulare 1956 TaxID=1299331 RepID=X8CTF6_MYCIT|nr:hypothetical protein I548_5412 [Mycobacterium intracellulare]EUA59304.1 hypothetical protein I550_2452 [Mycobacterium intracellulare 1956]
MQRLDLVVGPNGAGKSTFIPFTLAPLLPGSPVVNADEIARQRWPGSRQGAPTTPRKSPPPRARS